MIAQLTTLFLRLTTVGIGSNTSSQPTTRDDHVRPDPVIMAGRRLVVDSVAALPGYPSFPNHASFARSHRQRVSNAKAGAPAFGMTESQIPIRGFVVVLVDEEIPSFRKLLDRVCDRPEIEIFRCKVEVRVSVWHRWRLAPRTSVSIRAVSRPYVCPRYQIRTQLESSASESRIRHPLPFQCQLRTDR